MTSAGNAPGPSTGSQTNERWLVTGAAGFIGSHLVEHLLAAGHEVVGLDNFDTGHRRNLDEVLAEAGDAASRFRFIEADIRDPEACRKACDGVGVVLHQAALGSVPRSITDPVTTNAVNVNGFVHMLAAAKDAGVRRFVYAASSSTYGDHPDLPKREEVIGNPLSPYAVSKRADELYAQVFQRTYGLGTVGLRYFNVFGPRQDPAGAYAAVIPRWIHALTRGRPARIHGDGETSRDFCYVANAVQANILAAIAPREADGRIYNVACGRRTTLAALEAMIRMEVERCHPDVSPPMPEYGPFREGDVRHSEADISRIEAELGYQVEVHVEEGLRRTVEWFAAAAKRSSFEPMSG